MLPDLTSITTGAEGAISEWAAGKWVQPEMANFSWKVLPGLNIDHRSGTPSEVSIAERVSVREVHMPDAGGVQGDGCVGGE